jgi:hypothetical protein
VSGLLTYDNSRQKLLDVWKRFLHTEFVRSEDRVDEASGSRYPLVEDRIQAEIMHHIRAIDRPVSRSQGLLDKGRPDLVSLCLPNLGHFGPTLQVIEAGYTLVVEKPLVFDLREAETLLNEAPRRDLRYTPEPATGPSNWPMRRSIRWRPEDAATV